MTVLDFLLRILCAVLLGFLIGLERQLTGHVAGIRINILVSLGAAIFVLFSVVMEAPDLTRIAAQIVTGVGFLCSGIIVKDGANVRGLNTAATIWCTAAIGVLSSSGKYLFALGATAVLLLVNIIFRFIAEHVSPLGYFDEQEQLYRILLVCTQQREYQVRSMLIHACEKMRLIHLESTQAAAGHICIEALFSYSGGNRRCELAELLVKKMGLEKGVYKASWEPAS